MAQRAARRTQNRRSAVRGTTPIHGTNAARFTWFQDGKTELDARRGPMPIRLLREVRAGVAAQFGLSAFSDATVGADNSVAVNRQLSLASIRQEQSTFFQPSNILRAMK